MAKEIVVAERDKRAYEKFHFPSAVKHGDLILCSGRVGVAKGGVPDSAEEEFRNAWTIVGAVLEEGRCGFRGHRGVHELPRRDAGAPADFHGGERRVREGALSRLDSNRCGGTGDSGGQGGASSDCANAPVGATLVVARLDAAQGRGTGHVGATLAVARLDAVQAAGRDM